MVKNLPDNIGDVGSIPGLGRSPGERNGNPFQYSYLGNTMDRGACWATVQLVKKESDMTSWLKNDNTWQIMPKKDMIKYYTYTLNNRIQICINFNLTVIEIYSCVHALLSESCSVMSNSLWPHGPYSTWNSQGQNTPGQISFLQGIFPTQGSNPGLPHRRQILYQLSCKRSQRILEWVAYPFSSGSFWPRNQTGVSFIAGRFFTNWAIREARMLF